jgi:phosphoenolpyruvate carboxykinase (GTP)
MCLESISSNTIFTNVALTEDGDVWWEGLGPAPERLTDWQGQPWTPDCGRTAAHPNSRFTTPISQCPTVDEKWQSPEGVPLSAMIFGGRRAQLVPLVTELENWAAGVYFGATLASETTAAATGQTGVIRRDPMAMLPFCGYNMGDYFKHWLKFADRGLKLPLIFGVNWFRRNDQGQFVWPGYSENMRVLKWIFERVHRRAPGRRTALGTAPAFEDLDWQGLENYPVADFLELNRLDVAAWRQELVAHREFLGRFGDQLPHELMGYNETLSVRFKDADESRKS